MGAIHEAMGNRVIYDSGLSKAAKVEAIVNGDIWQWPVANSTELIMLKEFTLDIPPPNHARKNESFGAHPGQATTLRHQLGTSLEQQKTR